MTTPDTVRLLRECDAGVRMGVDSIDSVIHHVKHRKLKDTLSHNRAEHIAIQDEITRRLHDIGDEGKDPNPIAVGMSHMKARMKLMGDRDDSHIASLMTDGCHMGVKSLSKYLNQYGDADSSSRDIAKRIIALEEDLGAAMRVYL